MLAGWKFTSFSTKVNYWSTKTTDRSTIGGNVVRDVNFFVANFEFCLRLRCIRICIVLDIPLNILLYVFHEPWFETIFKEGKTMLLLRFPLSSCKRKHKQRRISFFFFIPNQNFGSYQAYVYLRITYTGASIFFRDQHNMIGEW